MVFLMRLPIVKAIRKRDIRCQCSCLRLMNLFGAKKILFFFCNTNMRNKSIFFASISYRNHCKISLNDILLLLSVFMHKNKYLACTVIFLTLCNVIVFIHAINTYLRICIYCNVIDIYITIRMSKWQCYEKRFAYFSFLIFYSIVMARNAFLMTEENVRNLFYYYIIHLLYFLLLRNLNIVNCLAFYIFKTNVWRILRSP